MRLSKFSFFVFLNFFQKIFKFFFCRQLVPPSSFLMFCSKLKFQKAQKVPLSSFRHCETVSKFSFFVFPNFFIVSFNFFWYFATDWFSKSWKGPPFYKFKNLALFWALDIAPTLDVPVLFLLEQQAKIFLWLNLDRTTTLPCSFYNENERSTEELFEAILSLKKCFLVIMFVWEPGYY